MTKLANGWLTVSLTKETAARYGLISDRAAQAVEEALDQIDWTALLRPHLPSGLAECLDVTFMLE